MMKRIRYAFVLCVLLLPGSGVARSLIGITTWPSFRFGNDIGRLDWYVDIRWAATSAWGRHGDSTVHVSWLDFEPSIGCNIAVYDSMFTAYLGGALGTLLDFQNNAYSDKVNIRLLLGGGIEWPLHPKLSILGEYLLGLAMTWYPETSASGVSYYYTFSLGLHSRPSIQLRYYIGPGR